MGFGGIGIGSLILIVLIVVLLFGTKKLRNVGGDVGGALKNFRKAMKDGDKGGAEETSQIDKKDSDAIDVEVVSKEKEKS